MQNFAHVAEEYRKAARCAAVCGCIVAVCACVCIPTTVEHLGVMTGEHQYVNFSPIWLLAAVGVAASVAGAVACSTTMPPCHLNISSNSSPPTTDVDDDPEDDEEEEYDDDEDGDPIM